MKKRRQPTSRDSVKSTLALMAAETADLETAAGGSITETVARWLAARYAAAARERLDELEGEDRMRFLGECVRDWSLLRRGDQSAEKLRLDRERLELARGLNESEITEKFEQWLDHPKVRRILNQGLSEEERGRQIRKLFGVPEKPQSGLSPETLAEIEQKLRLL